MSSVKTFSDIDQTSVQAVAASYPNISPVSFGLALKMVGGIRNKIFELTKNKLRERNSSIPEEASINSENESEEDYLSYGGRLARESEWVVLQNSNEGYYLNQVITRQCEVVGADVCFDVMFDEGRKAFQLMGAFDESIIDHSFLIPDPILESIYPSSLFYNEKKYLENQNLQYEAAKNQIIDKYKGKYVFFENGEVKEFSDDEKKLIFLVYKKYGRKEMLIKFVTEEESVSRQIYTPFISNPFD
jgi:hypothetical protein